MSEPKPLTKAGLDPNPAGRKGVSLAMRRVLEEGVRLTDPEAELDPEELRGWSARLSKLAAELADCVEAPRRNRVMEFLSASWTSDEENALRSLRLGLLGTSATELAAAVGISGRTVERIEAGKACQVHTAWLLATHFGLSTIELFWSADADGLCARTAGELREEMLSSPSRSRARG